MNLKRSVNVAEFHIDASSGKMDTMSAGGQLDTRFPTSFPSLKQFKCPFRGWVGLVESQTLEELDLQHWDRGRRVSGVSITLGSLPRLEVLRLHLHLEAEVTPPPISSVCMNLLFAQCIPSSNNALWTNSMHDFVPAQSHTLLLDTTPGSELASSTVIIQYLLHSTPNITDHGNSNRLIAA